MCHRSIALILLLGSAGSIGAQDAGIEFFEKKIRPILVEHCYECHAVTAKKIRGELLLDSRAGVRKGGESGPALVPGDPDKSLLIKAVRHADGVSKMPPKKEKLPAAVIADLEAWVKMGAPDPRDKAAGGAVAKSWEEVVRERRQWWSLQPIKKPSVPTPKNARWSHDPVDRFLLAAMEAKGLAPAKDADARTLIRRLNLVLTGLPPTAGEVEEFAKAWDAAGAKRQAVLEKLVDRLLASPHFGERWARHWMDVVRFTETHGNEWNYEVHHAWRYRDYLIRAFNDDVPYDQLVREHIAGDLLVKPRYCLPSPLRGRGVGGEGAARFNESIIGTAFYRFGEVNHDDCIDLRSIGYDLADNQIDTLSKAFQAMTIACARCHDHKLDAISMRDYHGLLGILRSSRQVAHTIDAPEVNADILAQMHDIKSAIRRELVEAWSKPLEADRIAMGAPALAEKALDNNPLAWLRLILDAHERDKMPLHDAWKKIADRFGREHAERAKFNTANFTTFADFRTGAWPAWQIGGQGLRGKPSKPGDFIVANDCEPAVAVLLPAGAYTHLLSDQLNGTLRSPVLTSQKKYISFRVLGDRAAAVRLVSNNCQLNYRNFRYLKNEWQWITFPIPPDAEGLRVYAELMTKYDNPKYPDQLGSLGGGLNARVPWEKTLEDPASYFGVTEVVLHDQPLPPKASLSHLRRVFAEPAPATRADLLIRFVSAAEEALRAWRTDKASDEDMLWLNGLLQAGALDHRAKQSPKLTALFADYRKLDGKLTLPRIVPGLADFGPGIDQPLFVRGDCMKPGDKTPRRYVEVLLEAQGRPSLGFATKGSGRLELANTIASPDNPLTARVMVNRIWHHLFGAGLVRTVDDFGHVGELPSHPELLDYLAHQFAASPGMSEAIPGGGHGWSLKKLIRGIVLTRAFQLSPTPSAAAVEVDPTNRLLSHYPARRMEAEAIRDSLLATSGRLERTLFGPSIPANRDKEYADRRLFKGPLDGNGRRSIYIKVTLMEAPKFLEVFNFPGGKVCQGRRDVTNTPAQALAMLNDPFVHQQADVWAKRLIARKNDTIASRIDAMFVEAMNRPPRAAERERFERFLVDVAKTHDVPMDRILGSALVWREMGHAMFNLQEFSTIP